MNTIGSICLAVWLILMRAVQVFDIKFSNRDKVMGVMAIIAGVVFMIGTLSNRG